MDRSRVRGISVYKSGLGLTVRYDISTLHLRGLLPPLLRRPDSPEPSHNVFTLTHSEVCSGSSIQALHHLPSQASAHSHSLLTPILHPYPSHQFSTHILHTHSSRLSRTHNSHAFFSPISHHGAIHDSPNIPHSHSVHLSPCTHSFLPSIQFNGKIYISFSRSIHRYLSPYRSPPIIHFVTSHR